MADSGKQTNKTNKSTSDMLKESRNTLYGTEGQDNEKQSTELFGLVKNLLSVMTSMDARLSGIELHMKNNSEQLTTINKKLSTIEGRVNKAENDIERVKRDVNDLENDLQGNSNILDGICEQTVNIERNIADMKPNVDAVSEMKNAIEILSEKVIDLQCRSMKYNLLFSGIPEADGEVTGQVLRDFIEKEMKVEEAQEICFGNVHRVGQRKTGKKRSIVARFIFNEEMQLVKRSGVNLKGKPYGVSEQYPPEVENKRKQLYPLMKAAKAKKSNKVRLVRDRLYVNDVEVTPDSADREANTTERRQEGPGSATQDRSSSRPNKRGRTHSTPERC